MMDVKIETVAVSKDSNSENDLLTRDEMFLVPLNEDEAETVKVEHLPNVGDFIMFRLQPYMVEAVLHNTARPNSKETAYTTLLVSQQFV